MLACDCGKQLSALRIHPSSLDTREQTTSRHALCCRMDRKMIAALSQESSNESHDKVEFRQGASLRQASVTGYHCYLSLEGKPVCPLARPQDGPSMGGDSKQ